jgi:hypothetical protein
MTKSPILNFLMGMITGGMLATILVVHVFTNQMLARNRQANETMDSAAKANADNLALAQRVIDTWQTRATACEAKFTVGTIVYQRQPMASFPILHGMAAFDLNDAAQPKPSLYIPAQVDIFTDRLDVRYAWIDGRSGAQQGGVHVAQSPSEVQ